MKRVLVTAGVVYGPLDDNKLVSNRVRGIWAARFARWLVHRGHQVTLLVADIQRDAISDVMQDGPLPEESTRGGSFDILHHHGFWDYQKMCVQLATVNDAAVMAAAVVNWIPAVPFPGKMPTAGYKSGDEINISFILAPRVIDQMRKENPQLTLIGCKMTIGATDIEMLDAAFHTLTGARCHAVIANDMKRGLSTKIVLYPDRATTPFDIKADEGMAFYEHLEAIITDEHFHTESCGPSWSTEKEEYARVAVLFDKIADKYRERFVQKDDHAVFGAIAVRVRDGDGQSGGALCSPREKGLMFRAADAVDVVMYPCDLAARTIMAIGPGHHIRKATMNAPLLLRHLDAFPTCSAVLHLHEQIANVPVVPYAPPGTVRDALREIPGPVYNIEGHGCIAALDWDGGFYWDAERAAR